MMRNPDEVAFSITSSARYQILRFLELGFVLLASFSQASGPVFSGQPTEEDLHPAFARFASKRVSATVKRTGPGNFTSAQVI